MASPLLIAKSQTKELALLPALANRHGLITGATGTGKSVTLQALAHRFSAAGVPVFAADVKGDLSGLSQPGEPGKAAEKRQAEHTLLRLVEAEHAAEEQRPHVGNRRAHGVAALAVEIPERHRAGLERDLGRERLQALGDLRVGAARLGDAGEIALHVGHEHRHAGGGEAVRERLQGHRLAGAGGAGDEAMAVGEGGQERELLVRVLR